MGGYSNPFDVPLNSEIQESQQRQAATKPLPSGYVNPFDEPLASEVAEQKLKENTGATIQPVTTSTNPKLAAAMSAKDMPEYVGATGAAAAGTMGLAIAQPVVDAAISHLGGLTKIVQAAKNLGWTTFGIKEAHDLYKMVAGEKK